MKEHPAPAAVAAYLDRLPDAPRAALERLRGLIRRAAPDAVECIAYGVPGFRVDGKYLVGYAAARNHLSFFPGAVVRSLAADLAGFEVGRGTVRFTPDRPLPAALIRQLVRVRRQRIAAPANAQPRKSGGRRQAPGASVARRRLGSGRRDE